MSRLNSAINFIVGKPVRKSQPVAPHQLSAYKRAVRRRELIRREAQVGGTVFGPIPEGRQREFFCLDRYTWIWSEQWFDVQSQTTQKVTTRYELQPQGVLKVVNEIPKGYLGGRELANFDAAMKMYGNKVATEVYGQPQLAV